MHAHVHSLYVCITYQLSRTSLDLDISIQRTTMRVESLSRCNGILPAPTTIMSCFSAITIVVTGIM